MKNNVPLILSSTPIVGDRKLTYNSTFTAILFNALSPIHVLSQVSRRGLFESRSEIASNVLSYNIFFLEVMETTSGWLDIKYVTFLHIYNWQTFHF